MDNKLFKGIAVVALGAIIWFSPVPAGLKPAAWHLFAIFAAVIIGFILKPVPIGAVAFAGVTFAALTGVLKPGEALSGATRDPAGRRLARVRRIGW